MSTSEGRLATPPVQLLTCCSDAPRAAGAAVTQRIATRQTRKTLRVRTTDRLERDVAQARPRVLSISLLGSIVPGGRVRWRPVGRSSPHHLTVRRPSDVNQMLAPAFVIRVS